MHTLQPTMSGAEGANGVPLGQNVLTTLMVRNIPVLYTQEMLLKEWPNNYTYDFLYLPISIERKHNCSFAFVNFVSEVAAVQFTGKWHKKRLSQHTSRKPLDISPADVQGRDANIRQILRRKTFRIRNMPFQPAIFDGNVRISMNEYRELILSKARGSR